MPKILAIDDKPDNLVALSALLKNLMPGCAVITAQSGMEGIEKAVSESPDTILLDVKMPDMDGFETCLRLKSDENTRHIPVIMITAIKTDPQSRIKGLEIGADAFLAKPIDPYELVSQVKVALRIKKAENALREERDSLERLVEERTAALVEVKESARDFLENVINTIADPVFVKDDKRHFVLVNEALCAIVGRPREALLGKEDGDMFPEEEVAVFRKMNAAVLDTGEENVNEELLSNLSSGEVRTIVTRKTRYIDPNGKHFLVGVIRDITEQKQLENRFRQAQKMESIGNLAGGIAHDFNNILTSVIGFTELSLDEVEKGTHIEDNLQEIYTAGKRAKDLVKQILAFARQSGEELKPIQVDTIATEVLKFIRSSIPTTIEIKQNIESDSLIMGNATQVHQILMNLFTNAAHAMEDTGSILEFSLKDVVMDRGVNRENPDLEPGNYIEIMVSDTGTGIAPEIIGSIFDPYFTTKGPGEGTGMGLAMIHGIIENYGGKIFVDSKPEQGTRFTIYLPVTGKRQEHRPYEPEMLPTGKERILFVDDEAPIAKIGDKALERLGYTVSIRTSSIEALALFRTKPNDFDLVITDMTMPNMTGDSLAIELMKIRPDIPVILCTGYSKKISDESASEMGIKAFLYKPIVKAYLAKTVRKVLDEAKDSTGALPVC